MPVHACRIPQFSTVCLKKQDPYRESECQFWFYRRRIRRHIPVQSQNTTEKKVCPVKAVPGFAMLLNDLMRRRYPLLPEGKNPLQSADDPHQETDRSLCTWRLGDTVILYPFHYLGSRLKFIDKPFLPRSRASIAVSASVSAR